MKKSVQFLVVLSLVLVTCQSSPSDSNSSSDRDSVALLKQFEKDRLTASELANYKKLGMEYANSTQAALGQKLMKKVGEKGTDGAVDFCNVEAIPLTDSMAAIHQVSIRRVTDRPRNPDNAASANELSLMKAYLSEIKDGKELEAKLKVDSAQVHFYYPINTNTFCLNCHGQPNKEVNKETLAILSERYPNDKALNYTANELRGMWSITFDR